MVRLHSRKRPRALPQTGWHEQGRVWVLVCVMRFSRLVERMEVDVARYRYHAFFRSSRTHGGSRG